MELYVPSVVLLVLVAFVILLIIPNMAPFSLVIFVTLILAITGYHHSSLFSDDYATSSWQQNVYASAGPFLIAMTVLLMLGFGLNFIRPSLASGTSVPAVQAPPPPAFGTNTIKSLLRDPFKTR
jgi:hypothetical protein